MSIMQTFKHWHQEGTQGPISSPGWTTFCRWDVYLSQYTCFLSAFTQKKKEERERGSRGREVVGGDCVHATSPSPMLAFMMALVVQWLRL